MNQTSSAFYRMLFNNSPVSIWVEDFSKVNEYILKLRSIGVNDIRAYFLTYPERFLECIGLLNVVDVNDATLRLFKAKSKSHLMESIHLIFKDEALDCLLESIIAISEGNKHFDGQGVNYDLEGNKIFFRISWNIPGPDLKDYQNVIVVIQDLTRLEGVRKELEESEVLFRCIFEQASEGILLFDKEGRAMLVNQAFSNLTGIPIHNIAGRFVWEIYTDFCSNIDLDERHKITPEYIHKLITDSQLEQQVTEYRFLDSRHKLHAFKRTILPIQTGKERLFAIVETDLSPIYRSEVVTSMLHRISHAVNEDISLEELFQVIHESLGRLLNVNNFFIALYDDKSKLITFPYLVDEMGEDASPVDADNSNSLTAMIIAEAQSVLLNEEEINSRNQLKPIAGILCKNFLGVPLVLSGNVMGAMALQSYTQSDLYIQDDLRLLESISEQIAFALHKKQSDEDITVLIQAIEQAGEGIVIFNAEGFIRYVNTVFEKTTGYYRDELLGKPVEYLPLDQNSRREMQLSWLRVRSSQPWRGKIDMIRKDGSKITLDMVVKPVIDFDGRLSSIIASCKDVTYDILREEQLKRTQRLEAIGRLTGGIAHDFNNVLSAVIGYTELAADDLDPESDSAQKLLEVLKSANRAKEMIRHLISFSRQEESKTELIELVDHVKESVRFLKSYLPRNINIVERYQVEDSAVIAVPGQIHQIIINLGTNSMHAIDSDHGMLEISVDEVSFSSRDMIAFPELGQSRYLKIAVRDNGNGIEENLLEHIFDPYFTTKSATEGTGLGLSIVHNIVQAHHGAIRVESKVGSGTTFFVYVPIYTADKWYPGIIEPTENADIAGNETIMFVDDEPILVNVFRQGLMKLGYKVEGFTDPRKALEYFKKNHLNIDIVLTDTTMPYMNGVDLAEKLMAIKCGIPVVVCTGFSTLISEEDARRRGIRDFVMKPIKIKDIATLARDILDQDKRKFDADRLTPE
ncbi:MAG: PAS domain S-box protein [Candidatus Cloacimonadaceae bacterium]|nr:PAS domain S-box protein [Candidatus Cloacimonadaceae bacterium]MDP3114447.1 PAS domain S-box protein [Candidatus Cloacimonadaceae bacterium]